MSLKIPIAASIVMLLFCAVSSAQLTRGFISGTVQDSSGGAIDGVEIRISNLDTGISKEMLTNSAGVYRFVAVEPGAYSAEISKIGFETRKFERIEIGSNQEKVVNASLDAAAVITTVQVTDAPPGVELAKSTPTISRSFDAQQIENMPLISTREVTRLALLTPTVARTTGANGFAGNGQRPRNNNFTVDGVDNNDSGVSTAAMRVLPEQVSELLVQTAAYSAEFGRNSGAHIAATTKSGTNQFHGDVRDYFAADWMEALTLGQKRTGYLDTPRYVMNEPGGSIGGRIIRDKTFFFSLIDTTRRLGGPNVSTASAITIPTEAGFAALSNVPLGPDQTTQSRQATLAGLAFLKDYYPKIRNYDSKSTTPINGVPIEVGTTRTPIVATNLYWLAANRVDHQLTSKDSLSYRNVFDRQNILNGASNVGFGDRWAAGVDLQAQTHALSETRAFSPNLINEFRGSFTRKDLMYHENDPVTPTTNINSLQTTFGGQNTYPQSRVQDTFQFQDVATYIVNRHSLKVGIDFRRLQVVDFVGSNTRGTWTFPTLADYLNNRASQVVQALSTATSEPRQNLMGLFFQDDFKISRNLTLNIGLRYEYNSIPLGFFGATDPKILATGVPGPTRGDKNNWGPRLGLAYSPNPSGGLARTLLGSGQTVFRGGYGVAYDQFFLNLVSLAAANPPRVVSDTKLLPDTLNLYPTLPRITTTGPTFNPLSPFSNFPENAQNPTTHFYSFSIQREFGNTNVFEIGYSGNRNYHQIRFIDTNYATITPAQAQTVISTLVPTSIPVLQQRRLNPVAGSRFVYETSANSNYNALYLRFDKRLSHGLQLGANYTWSKLMSDNDDPLAVTNLTDSSPAPPQDYRNIKSDWSRSALDRPQRLVVSYSYRIPWLTSGMANRAVPRQIFSGWQIAGFSEFQSGQPFTVRTGVDSLGNGRPDSARPDYNPNGILLLDSVEGNMRSFSAPLVGGVFVTPLTAAKLPLLTTMPFGGNLGRNTFRAPGFTTTNLSLSKTFSINERWKIRVRNDVFNLMNHRNFAPPQNMMGAANFGENFRDQVGDSMRNMLASLKVIF